LRKYTALITNKHQGCTSHE